jgi:uncharacterized protein (DUF2147 family)
MIKNILIIPILFLITLRAQAQQQIVGKWLSEDGEGITEVYQEGDQFFGKIIWLKTTVDKKGKPFTDIKNPNTSKRKQPLIGLIIMKNFVFNDKKWKGGTIYDPDSGKEYICTMWFTDDNILYVRGYWGIFFQTQRWSRI